VAAGYLDWLKFQSIAADTSETTVRLSADSLTLFLFTAGLTTIDRWAGTDGEPDETETDAIDTMLATAYAELMTEVIVSVPIGVIFPFMTENPPAGSLECDGTEYLRVDYPALYAALDAAFITDADHFVTPDLRGRAPIGVGTGSGLSAYAQGDTGGEETHTLTEAELAVHDHTVTDHGHLHSNINAAVFLANARGNLSSGIAIQGTRNTELATADITVDNAGSGTAHENRQPYLALRFAVCAL